MAQEFTLSTADIYVDDIGEVFEATLKEGTDIVDISTATAVEFYFRKPDATTSEDVKAGTFKTDGTDGIVSYTTVADDLPTSGAWQFQVKITTPLATWRTEVKSFRVKQNL